MPDTYKTPSCRYNDGVECFDHSHCRLCGWNPFNSTPTKIYICSPYSGNTESNIKFARQMCRIAFNLGYEPIAPHMYYTQFLDDTNADERAIGMRFGLALLAGCAELWVCGKKVSKGMQKEIEFARKKNIRIRYIGGGERK